MKNPTEIISELVAQDQSLLNKVLNIEKRRLHIQKIKNNSREERELVDEIVQIINQEIHDDN